MVSGPRTSAGSPSATAAPILIHLLSNERDQGGAVALCPGIEGTAETLEEVLRALLGR